MAIAKTEASFLLPNCKYREEGSTDSATSDSIASPPAPQPKLRLLVGRATLILNDIERSWRDLYDITSPIRLSQTPNISKLHISTEKECQPMLATSYESLLGQPFVGSNVDCHPSRGGGFPYDQQDHLICSRRRYRPCDRRVRPAFEPASGRQQRRSGSHGV